MVTLKTDLKSLSKKEMKLLNESLVEACAKYMGKKKGLKDLSGVKRTPYSCYVPSRFRGVIYSPWSIQGQPCTGLPLAVIKWAGIKHKECKYKSGVSNSYVCLDDNGRRTDFATLNDGDTPHTKPMSFNEIATIIQKKWKEL